ncbi:MAG: isocitrate lyase/phosphoenolpyruvate mutase family protein [Sneathiellales bacterium]|nr:isocitrate lyase/phosphoenolpyruvate mutase family protein [Sneathiellales bacterium]
MTEKTTRQKQEDFHALHKEGCFIMANSWDAGSAVILEKSGFKATASTSSGFAWSLALPDHKVSLELVLNHLKDLCSVTSIPVSADFENAYAASAAEVEENISRAVETGIAGVSIEDSTSIPGDGLYDFEEALARVKAARKAIDASGSKCLLTARTEEFLVGGCDLDETVKRLKAFADAGADCLFSPGIKDEAHIAHIVEAVAPLPVNILTFGLSFETLKNLGVRRISVGGALTHHAYRALKEAGDHILETGEFESSKPNKRTGIAFNKMFSE